MRAIFLCALMMGTAAAAQSGLVGSRSAPLDIQPFSAREITPKVHFLSVPEEWFGPAISNVIVIEQSDGFVLIDSGTDVANGRAVVAYVHSLSPKPIKAVAITHWHNDHPQGISAIRDAFPKVRIISTVPTEEGMLGPEASDIGFEPDLRADAAIVKQVEDLKAQYRKLYEAPSTSEVRRARIKKAIAQLDGWARDFPGTYIVPPTETFEHELRIDDRDEPVRLMFLGRANTAGDLVAWLPADKIIASGDIVVSPIPFGFGSYPADWVKTIQKLKAFGFRTLLPGHGLPQSDTAYLDKMVTAISDVQAQVGLFAKQSLSLDDVKKKVDFTKMAALFGSTANEHAAFQALFSDPMIENAYKEALGQPIVQGQGVPKSSFDVTPPKSRAIHHKS